MHMYSTVAARGMGPEPRRISAARGGEGEGECGGEVARGGLPEKKGSRLRERGRKYRPNYGAAPMRNVSTIQLLLSKYLMWPGRLSAQCPPAFLSCSAAGGSSLSFLGNAQLKPTVCVSVCVWTGSGRSRPSK